MTCSRSASLDFFVRGFYLLGVILLFAHFVGGEVKSPLLVGWKATGELPFLR